MLYSRFLNLKHGHFSFQCLVEESKWSPKWILCGDRLGQICKCPKEPAPHPAPMQLPMGPGLCSHAALGRVRLQRAVVGISSCRRKELLQLSRDGISIPNSFFWFCFCALFRTHPSLMRKDTASDRRNQAISFMAGFASWVTKCKMSWGSQAGH